MHNTTADWAAEASASAVTGSPGITSPDSASGQSSLVSSEEKMEVRFPVWSIVLPPTAVKWEGAKFDIYLELDPNFTQILLPDGTRLDQRWLRRIVHKESETGVGHLPAVGFMERNTPATSPVTRARNLADNIAEMWEVSPIKEDYRSLSSASSDGHAPYVQPTFESYNKKSAFMQHQLIPPTQQEAPATATSSQTSLNPVAREYKPIQQPPLFERKRSNTSSISEDADNSKDPAELFKARMGAIGITVADRSVAPPPGLAPPVQVGAAQNISTPPGLASPTGMAPAQNVSTPPGLTPPAATLPENTDAPGRSNLRGVSPLFLQALGVIPKK